MRADRKEYYLENKEKIKAYQRGRAKENKELKAKWSRQLKYDVLNHYSRGTMKCSRCGDTIFENLCLHHKNGYGARHRESLGLRGLQFYIYLRKEGFPNSPPLGVLCKTCNVRHKRLAYRVGSHRKLSQERINYAKELRGKGLTYEELGRILNVTSSWAWQICKM